MVIDALTRLWPAVAPFGPVAAPPEPATLRHNADFLSGAVVAGYRSIRLGIHVSASDVAAHVATDPAFFTGFAGVDPLSPTLESDLREAADLGLQGVTLAPADQGCRPTHERCRFVLERCAAMGVPVLVSNPGLADPRSVIEFARPAFFDEACRELPALALIFGDLGRAWRDEALLMAERHERVFVELSSVVTKPSALAATLTEAHERGVVHKVLFSSGYPLCNPALAVERIYALTNFVPSGGVRPPVPRDALRSIIERDPLAALGLERPARARIATAPRQGAIGDRS